MSKPPITCHLLLRLDGNQLESYHYSAHIAGDIFIGDRLLGMEDIGFEVRAVDVRTGAGRGVVQDVAPELLKLLKEAHEGWAFECECGDPAIDGCWRCETAAAIVKAKGEQR